MIKDHLEKYNYQVFFTLTGANAIERIKELSPDLIILDLMLPFISGDELIRNIRKFSDVPVIVVSAKSLTLLPVAYYQVCFSLAQLSVATELYTALLFIQLNLYTEVVYNAHPAKMSFTR